MGRRRAVDRNALLDAAETVIRRDGAARLTLEAVAAEAGISKASVLYELGSKQNLTHAVVARRVAEWKGMCAAQEQAMAGRPNAAVHAVLSKGAHPLTEADRSTAVALSLALFQDEALRRPIQADIGQRIEGVLRDSPTPIGALCALMAIEGLLTMERFDLHRFDPEVRARLVAAIGWIADHEPGACDPVADVAPGACAGPRIRPRPARGDTNEDGATAPGAEAPDDDGANGQEPSA